MALVDTILLILAAICFALVGFEFKPSPRLNLIGLGLFFWVMVAVLGRF